MKIDLRNHPRFKPEALDADITITPPEPDEIIHLQGNVIDMSYSGIKIKLFSAIPNDIPESQIKIKLMLPELNVPATINGVIKHLNSDAECGIGYDDNLSENEIDDLMFECIKLSSNTTNQQLGLFN